MADAHLETAEETELIARATAPTSTAEYNAANDFGGEESNPRIAAEVARLRGLGPRGRADERARGRGPMQLPNRGGESAAIAFAENQLVLLGPRPLEGRFIFSFVGPSTDLHNPFTAKSNFVEKEHKARDLIHLHLGDLKSELASWYPEYGYFILKPRRRNDLNWHTPKVHSLRNGQWARLVPDHVERRHSDGRWSTYYVTALIEGEVNLAIGFLRTEITRGTL